MWSQPFRIATLTGSAEKKQYEALEIQIQSQLGTERVSNVIKAELPIEHCFQTAQLDENIKLITAQIPHNYTGAKLLLGVQFSHLFPTIIQREQVPKVLLRKFPKAVFFISKLSSKIIICGNIEEAYTEEGDNDEMVTLKCNHSTMSPSTSSSSSSSSSL